MCRALKELQEDQDLVIIVLMDKDYYCNKLVIKHHISTGTYQKVDSNSDKRVFNNLKLLIKKQESCLTKIGWGFVLAI